MSISFELQWRNSRFPSQESCNFFWSPEISRRTSTNPNLIPSKTITTFCVWIVQIDEIAIQTVGVRRVWPNLHNDEAFSAMRQRGVLPRAIMHPHIQGWENGGLAERVEIVAGEICVAERLVAFTVVGDSDHKITGDISIVRKSANVFR
jgi:hypothetical protein